MAYQLSRRSPKEHIREHIKLCLKPFLHTKLRIKARQELVHTIDIQYLTKPTVLWPLNTIFNE